MKTKKVTGIEIISPGSAPDVDSDFNTIIRENVLEYVTDVYGKDNVSNIITFGTLAAKGAFKAMCTIYEIPFSQANKIANLVPPPQEGNECTLDDIFNPNSDRYDEGAEFRSATASKEWTKIIEGARKIEGRNKSTGVHACFSPDTLITTSQGYRRIDEIQKGDYVLTHTNSYKEVVETMVNDEGTLFSIAGVNSLPTEVTGDHPVYVRNIERTKDKTRKLSAPIWKRVEDLVIGEDLIGIPVNTDSKIPTNSLDLPYEDPDFWWIVGCFVGDGCTSVRNRKKKNGELYKYRRQENNIVISVGYNDSTHDQLIQKVNKLFNYRISPSRTTNKIYITQNNDLFTYLKTFGQYAQNKVVPNDVISLPNNLLKKFIEGYLSADGWFDNKTQSYTFSTVSKSLALSMISAINKVYRTHCSVTVEKRSKMTIENREVECQDRYIIRFKEGIVNKQQSFYKDDYIWAKLKKVEKLDKKIRTYNFSVIDDNSYVANGFVAHNCGIIISSEPLEDVIPLQVRQNDGRVITQWTYKECESLGLIKMDFLGLDTVDLIQHSVEYIIRNGKTPPNMLNIIHGNMDDSKVYELFQKGFTTGIFQFGSDMVKNLLLIMRPTEFNDLAACTAVARPGPMGMKSHVRYADRKNSREQIDFIHPEFKGTAMEEILGDTFGLCVPAGTPILDTTTGLYIPIENVTPNVTVTPSFNESNGNTENKTITNLVQTGFKNIVKISLNGGRSLRVSDTHPVLTQRGYVPAGEITAQDKVVVSAQEVETQSANSMSNDRSYFLGAMLGDGSITGNSQPYITNSEEDILLEMERISSMEFPSVFTHRTKRIRDGVHYTTNLLFKSGDKDKLCSGKVAPENEITTWLSKIGYNGKVLMYSKFVSDYVMKTSNENLKHLIGGIWDTDGMVSNNMVHFTTTSKRLFEDVKNILTRIGVDFGCTVQPYMNKTREDRVAYRIYPTFVDFKNKIQPYLRSERKKFAFISRTAISHNGKTGYLTYLENDFTEWVSENVPQSLYTSGVTNALKRGQKVGWKAIKTFFNANYKTTLVSKTEVINFAHEKGVLSESTIVKLNTRLRSVLSVVPDGTEMCYDIEVEDNHNFFVNGVVVHNCVYQEQVIKIANLIAGMTLQEGDDLRKAMGKKIKEKMDEMRPKFFSGALAKGFSNEAVTTLWDTIAEFAKYGFNKSHSVAYAMNAYQSAYLKAHYPVEFMAALIAQNVGDRNKTLAFLREAKRMGINMGTVDINLSDIKVAPDYSKKSGHEILFGLSGVKEISENMAKIIVDERTKNGYYKSVQDLIDRCAPLGVTNRKVFENLALAGAFDHIQSNRRAVVESVNNLMGSAKKKTIMGDSLFDMFDIEEDSGVDENIEDFPFVEKLKHEADMVGLYLSAHPLDNVEKGLGGSTTVANLLKSTKKSEATILASVVDIKKKQHKKGKTIILDIDDGTGFMSAKLSPIVIESLDKHDAQENLKKLYEYGENEINSELKNKALNPKYVSIPPIEKNSVYLINITFQPGRGDNPYGARINFIKPLSFAHNGTLPIRIRFKFTENNVAKMNKLYKSLPAALSKKIEGNYPIHICAYKTLDMSSVNKKDYPYRQAVIDMEYDEKHGINHNKNTKKSNVNKNILGETQLEETSKKSSKKAKVRSWPPVIDKKSVHFIDDDETTQSDITDVIESLEYVDSGFSTDKTQQVAQLIEKYVGCEAYDFGIFNPEVMDNY